MENGDSTGESQQMAAKKKGNHSHAVVDID
jgi:hypothetical protein